jgi:methyl-accepting chemotaxis protein
MIMAKHSDERNYSKHFALLTALFLPLGAIALVSDAALAQQQQQQPRQQHAQVRRTATRVNPPERTNTTPDTTPVPVVPVALPSPAIDQTSALGQALAACNQDAAVQEAFTLPGLKSDVTLDRCYKGRAHLICVFTALSTEAKSLTSSYTKIVEANYPDLNTVDGVCQLNPETLATNIVGSEDFAKRFKELKSQYEATTNCAGNIEQAFKNVTLTDMVQAPEIIKSMTASIDGDVAKISKVHEQISNLAEKMELSKKAMKTLTKIYHAMCLQGARAAGQSGAVQAVEHR